MGLELAFSPAPSGSGKWAVVQNPQLHNEFWIHVLTVISILVILEFSDDNNSTTATAEGIVANVGAIMPDHTSRSPRTGKELLEATRPFAVESRIKSWWCVGSTFTALGAMLCSAALAPWWPLRVAASVVGGLLFVRAFILFHDFLHGSLLRDSRLAGALFYVYGLVALTPARIWRRSHNFHHANVGKPIPSDNATFSLFTSDVGSFPLMTTAMWLEASTW